MIKLTEFTSVVDTYKKNFAIRSKRFSDKKKKDQAVNKEQREARIESKKFFSSVGAKVAAKIKPGGNILDTVIRFAGFTLLGVLVKNLDKVAAFAKQVIEKVKEFAIRFKKYFDDVLVPLFNDIVGLGTQIKDTFGDIANFVIRMNPYNELSDVLGTVMSGILALGYRIAGLYRPFTKPTTPGATPPATKATKAPAKTPVKAPVKTPAKTPVKAPAKTPAKTTARPRVIAKTFAPSIPVTAGKGTGTGTGTGVPKATSAAGMLSDDLLNILKKSSDDALKSTVKEFLDLKGSEPFSKDLDPTKDLSKNIDSASRANFKKFIEALEKEKLKADIKFRKELGLDTSQGAAAAQQAAMDIKSDLDKGRSLKPGASVLDDLLGTPKLSPIEKLKSLIKGLNFRFDAGKVIKEQLLNPKNLLSNIKNFGIGVGLDVGARFLGKYISSILPYNEDFELLAYLGMIDPDRIHQLTAGKIINLPEDKRIRAIERLERDSKSSDDIFGTGQKKREVANGILKYISIFSGGEIAPDVKPKVPAVVAPKQIPEPLINKPDPTIIPKNKRADDEFVYPDGSILRPGMTVGKLNNTGGLDGPTTYGSQGVMISREVVIAIQPVEVPA